MVDARQIEARINKRANQIIKYAELAIRDERVLQRFRSFVLSELGGNGLRSDLIELLDLDGRDGTERKGKGRTQDRQERRCPMID